MPDFCNIINRFFILHTANFKRTPQLAADEFSFSYIAQCLANWRLAEPIS